MTDLLPPHKGRNLQGLALIVGGIGEGQCTVVVDSWFCCQQGDMIDADNSLINVAPALAVVLEGSGLGGFEGVARPVGLYLFRNRFDLDEDRRCGIDTDCAKGQGFTGVPRSIAQCQFTVAVLSVSGEADNDFKFLPPSYEANHRFPVGLTATRTRLCWS